MLPVSRDGELSLPIGHHSRLHTPTAQSVIATGRVCWSSYSRCIVMPSPTVNFRPCCLPTTVRSLACSARSIPRSWPYGSAAIHCGNACMHPDARPHICTSVLLHCDGNGRAPLPGVFHGPPPPPLRHCMRSRFLTCHSTLLSLIG